MKQEIGRRRGTNWRSRLRPAAAGLRRGRQRSEIRNQRSAVRAERALTLLPRHPEVFTSSRHPKSVTYVLNLLCIPCPEPAPARPTVEFSTVAGGRDRHASRVRSPNPGCPFDPRYPPRNKFSAMVIRLRWATARQVARRYRTQLN
jgi:hypothetical protein